MAKTEVELVDGLKLDGEPQRHAVLREPTAGDVIEANAEAEKMVPTPDGYQLLVSPTMVGAIVLGKQVVSIGEIPGPLSLRQVKMLSPTDYQRLQFKAQALESASAEVAQRGRDDAGGAPAE
ncbi:hypothetical protein FAZ79_00470 [Guyparkeria sp. SB14A]|uniref:phage tail assembly protein n=1 Tax=Guyparkeria sp. SB14A TaxID=2571147 RepID=UPI0010ACBDEA|nr:phage tail assembly protein [Guyparkeria sp. SB14A]TKA91813.1 hypothetical protein FAZ79_00470 [Guyparkeria sp. SB14A]